MQYPLIDRLYEPPPRDTSDNTSAYMHVHTHKIYLFFSLPYVTFAQRDEANRVASSNMRTPLRKTRKSIGSSVDRARVAKTASPGFDSLLSHAHDYLPHVIFRTRDERY